MASTIPKNIAHRRCILDILREAKRSGSTGALLKQGYTYAQIAELLAAAIAARLIEEKEGALSLTAEGKKTLFESRNRKKFFWLMPLNESRVAKIEKNALYVPERRSLQKIRNAKNRASN
jgi:hypothetical protein